ncbi:MAG: hypothetical protein CMH56_06385 [Myxococcales bacterium]|nr:hypothetical protein [Myxococcales bacterium]|tara:strand:- start:3641 stop:4702 length:1062 start_codon:yes stop_codon:yes gene_type:complete
MFSQKLKQIAPIHQSPTPMICVPVCAFLLLIGCPDETATGPAGPSSDTDAGLIFQQSNNTPPSTDAGHAIQDNGETPVADAGNPAPDPDPGPQCTCPDGYDPTPADDACTKTITVAATNEGTSYEVCDAQDNWVYGKFGAQYPGGTKVRNEYWGESDGPGTVNGRLNEVGIWACNENTGQAGYDPVGEWIGFAHCLNLDGKGDYLVGIAGDNQVRLKLNGETVFEYLENNTAAFNYWWISALHVNSGMNIIEMQGYNAHSVASFGAEIAGPFPFNSLENDEAMIAANYEDKIVFSTGVMVGQSFDVGEDSGWTCPDGYALNRCLPEPECTYIDVIPCVGESDVSTPATDGGTP